MKKLIICLLTVALFILPVSPLCASADTVSFFEAIRNTAAIGDHKMIQSFYGSTEFKEGGDHLNIEYRISINSAVNKDNRMNQFSRLGVFLKFINHNEVSDATPFKEMTVQANAEIITQDQNDIYFKLNHFNIGLTKALPFAIVDTENLKAMADLYRNKWFHTSVKTLAMQEGEEEVVDLDQYMAFQEQLKENPKEAFLGFFELILNDADAAFTEKEINELKETMALLLEKELFNQRMIVAGQNTGFRFFNLNKSEILNLAEKIATVFGEKITTEDKLMIRAGLGKISLSGIYRTDEIDSMMDNLLIRFRLRETGPLRNLELNYRFKIWDIDKENSIKTPVTYEEWGGLFGGFDDELFYEDEF